MADQAAVFVTDFKIRGMKNMQKAFRYEKRNAQGTFVPYYVGSRKYRFAEQPGVRTSTTSNYPFGNLIPFPSRSASRA